MMLRSKLSWILALACLLASPMAEAHLLKVFAWADGDAIVGNAYFSGGIPAKGANIRLQNKAGKNVVNGHPNEKGDFRLQIPEGQQIVKVIADTQDGHLAHWDLNAVEESSETTTDSSATATSTGSQGASVDSKQIKQLVSQAVAEQIGPLRMQLDKNATKFRLADILGGIGYIFGLMGICMWLKSRKQEQS